MAQQIYAEIKKSPTILPGRDFRAFSLTLPARPLQLHDQRLFRLPQSTGTTTEKCGGEARRRKPLQEGPPLPGCPHELIDSEWPFHHRNDVRPNCFRFTARPPGFAGHRADWIGDDVSAAGLQYRVGAGGGFSNFMRLRSGPRAFHSRKWASSFEITIVKQPSSQLNALEGRCGMGIFCLSRMHSAG